MAYAHRTPVLLTLGACAWLLSACSGGTPASRPSDGAEANAAAASGPYKPVATLQEIMDSVLDFASDYIWQAVSATSDEKGIHEQQPRTDEEWHEFRRRAILLVESANLLAVPGRRVAVGSKTVEGGDPLEVQQIQQRLDTRHDEFVGFAAGLRDISLKLVEAADKRDVAAITELGGTLDEVCEACHKVFWYPDQPQVAAPK